jgi:predicted acetylornithine/succinylornithine family transaminase
MEEGHTLARENVQKIQQDVNVSPPDLLDRENRHSSGVYPKRPVAIVRGQGITVWDAEGHKYLDMTSGQGVALIGHSHPTLVNAVQHQVTRLITCPEIFYNDQRAAFYSRLAERTPSGLDLFFLCNSGAEAIEGAIKLARLVTKRSKIVAIQRGFHGRTMGALSATWKAEYREPFAPLVPGFSHIPFNDIEAASAALTRETAAVLVEVIQGEGGVYCADRAYLQTLRQLCDECGALLILDEIQTGLGRTGRWFACEHFDVVPDILCMGKGIAGGLPMGVVAWRRSLGSLPKGSHGSTFGGNPLVCAAATTTLHILAENGLIDRADRLGTWFLEKVQAIRHPLIRDVRGKGLMIGIELRQRVTPVLKILMERGVLALPAGLNVLRLLPPLVVEKKHLEKILELVQEALNEMQNE